MSHLARRDFTAPSTPRERAVSWSLRALTVVVAGLCAWHVVDLHRADVVREERAAYGVAQDRLTSRAGAALHLIQVTQPAIADAQKTLDSSAGKTLDATARTALETAIRQDTQLIGVAEAEQKLANAASTAKVNPSYWGPEYPAAADSLDKWSFVSADHLHPVPANLTKAQAAVTAAVAAWQAEQDRIAAEKAAQAAAEAAARARAAQNSPSSDHSTSSAAAPSSGSGGSRTYHEYVWTSGWQPEIDQCRGGVDLTGHYGVRTVAEHSYCGGYAWPKTAGTLVQFTGVDAGLYRVIGIVANLNGHTATTADLPRGYDLLYQTCVNGYSNMSFTALQKVG